MKTTDREYRRYLRSLVWQVEECLRAFDAVMREPSTVERGRRIAQILNALELSKDAAKRFGLGLRSSKPVARPA